MKKNTKQFISKPLLAKPWVYFLATYAWTWSFFGIAYALGLSAETGGILGTALVLGALSGPAIMAAIFVKLALNKKGQDDYWKRIFDFKRISGKWYLAILLLIPSIGMISAILSGYWQFYTFANVTPSLLLTALVIPLVPLLEELGWRGYVLDRLQENYNALSSSIILGILWGLWHLPAFFLMGGGLSVIPFASLAFFEYMGGLVALSVCMTWIYNNTRRSTLSAVLFHMVLEFCADTGLFPWNSPELSYHLGFHVGLWAIVAIGIAIHYGTQTLRNNVQDNNNDLGCAGKGTSRSIGVNPKNENKNPKEDYDDRPVIQSKYTPYLGARKAAHIVNSADENSKETRCANDLNKPAIFYGRDKTY